MQAIFDGDNFYKPSHQLVPITVYLSTSFVAWGGNAGGLKLGQDVNFWGSSWPDQVITGDYVAAGDFKGFADPLPQVHVCAPQARSVSEVVAANCWTSKAGQNFPPPLTIPA